MRQATKRRATYKDLFDIPENMVDDDPVSQSTFNAIEFSLGVLWGY